MQAQDVDRAQSRHPPNPGWGWRSSCCRLGTRDVRGRGGAHVGAPGEHQSLWGLPMLPVSTIETADPGVAQIVSKDSSRETAERGDPGCCGFQGSTPTWAQVQGGKGSCPAGSSASRGGLRQGTCNCCAGDLGSQGTRLLGGSSRGP